MNVKNRAKVVTQPFHYNQSITVFYEMKHGNDQISAGTVVRFKNRRGTFKFVKLVHNAEKNVSWIDCMETNTGIYRSFYVEELKGMVKPKKRRKKRASV